MDDSLFETIKNNLKNLDFDRTLVNTDRCSECVYSSLCGNWGFD